MNKAELKGKIIEITEVKTFYKGDASYNFRTVVIDVNAGIIAANYWVDDELPPVGTIVNFVINITSERNNKNPELFYHKVNLHKIYDSSRIPKEVHY